MTGAGDSVAQDWPAAWQFSAPESHVLAYNGGAFGAEPLKLAVMELVARGVLRVEMVQRRRLLKVRPHAALYEGPRPASPVAPSLAPVLSAFRAARRRAPGDGVFLADFAAAARAELGRPTRYHKQHVVPGLVACGMLERWKADVRWTLAGRNAEADLGRWIALGRENLARWRADDPARAAAYVQGAGAALLLAHDLYPELEALDRRHNPYTDDRVSQPLALAALGDPSEHDGDLDFDSIGLDLGGIDLDLSALGTLGDFGGVFDGSFGDGGGGGDGGSA